MSYILNGKLMNEADIILPVDKNGSFWYGDGFFETMKYVNRKIAFIEQHWARMVISCSILKMNNPFKEVAAFINYVDLLTEKSENTPQKIKLILWRNTFQAYQPENDSVEFLITNTVFNEFNYSLNTNGLKLGIYTDNLKSISKLGNVKSTSSQLYVLATLYTQSKKMDDSILLNTRKNLIETSRSNLWMVSQNTLYTSPLNEGCLDGIMRRVLLEICNEENIHVQQEPLTMHLLEKSEEVFTTNSLRGIQWVQQVEEKEYPNHSWAIKLNELLNKKAQLV